MEKNGLKLDALQMREKDFDMKSELFALNVSLYLFNIGVED